MRTVLLYIVVPFLTFTATVWVVAEAGHRIDRSIEAKVAARVKPCPAPAPVTPVDTDPQEAALLRAWGDVNEGRAPVPVEQDGASLGGR